MTTAIVGGTLYADTSIEVEHGYRMSSHQHDLKQEALHLRTHGDRAQRIAFLVQLGQALAAPARWEDETRPWQAQAFHLVAFTLSSEVGASELLRIVQPALDRIAELRPVAPSLYRFEGYLTRTTSMLMSKLDDYVTAYRLIVAAHAALADAPPDADDLTGLDAEQQVWLQECGQLIRLVETLMVESDRQQMREALLEGAPPTAAVAADTLRLMRIVAARGVFAGRRAVEILERITAHNGGRLPKAASEEGDDLAVASWQVTAPIMYARAVLVKATVDMATGREPTSWQTVVPDLFIRCLAGDVEFVRSHTMDLNRLALHHSLLSDGAHPMAGTVVFQTPAAESAPPHLHGSEDGRLDQEQCSRDLAAGRQNANILDNLGFAPFFRVLSERSGTARVGGGSAYAEWLATHRTLRESDVLDRWDREDRIAAGDPATAESIHGAIRVARRSTIDALPAVADLTAAAPHFVRAGWR